MGCLFDEYCKKDNTHTLNASDYKTGELLVFSKFSSHLLFEGVVSESIQRDAIIEAIRDAEIIAYDKAVMDFKENMDAYILLIS